MQRDLSECRASSRRELTKYAIAFILDTGVSGRTERADGSTVVSFPIPQRKGVMRMVTYSDLFAFCMLIVDIIGLVIIIINTKRK